MSLKIITPLPGLVYWDLFSFKAIVHTKLQFCHLLCPKKNYTSTDRFDYDGGEDFQGVTVYYSQKAIKLLQKAWNIVFKLYELLLLSVTVPIYQKAGESHAVKMRIASNTM